MNIIKTDIANQTILSLEGRLDTTTAPQLQTQLLAEFDTGKNIQIDFDKLTYVSSAGLRVILMGEKTAKAKDVKMTIKNVSSEIMEVFNMTGFSGILHIE